MLAPVLYLPHGGGPLPVLGDPDHRALTAYLAGATKDFGRPDAILVISAHWETAQPTITSGTRPELIYDYAGFPPESYNIEYPAPGEPELAHRIGEQLRTNGIAAELDERRGFDHGLFIPLKLMYPDAALPCLQLSLQDGFDPQSHITIGRALSVLREWNVLIVGSGMSFHNMRAFFRPSEESRHHALAFDQWLNETCSHSDLSVHERERRLTDWAQAPQARFCHPREEHLLPLHVCFGAAATGTPIAKVVFSDTVMNHRVSAVLWPGTS